MIAITFALPAESSDFVRLLKNCGAVSREGVETVREIRQRSAHVKILAVSGGGAMKTLDYLAMAEALGADRSLAKPFTARALVQVVGELLAAGASE